MGLAVYEAEVTDLSSLTLIEGVGRIDGDRTVEVPIDVKVAVDPIHGLAEQGMEGRGHGHGRLVLEDDDQEVHPVAFLTEHGHRGDLPAELRAYVCEDVTQGDGLAAFGVPTEHWSVGVGLDVSGGVDAIATEAVATGGLGCLGVFGGQLVLALRGSHVEGNAGINEQPSRALVDTRLDDHLHDLGGGGGGGGGGSLRGLVHRILQAW